MPEHQQPHIVILYPQCWGHIDDAHEFRDKRDALRFAQGAQHRAAVVLCGSMMDWVDGEVGKPIAVYWGGERVISE